MTSKRRKRVQHKVDPHHALRDTPLWKIHRMLADLSPREQLERIHLLAKVAHPDARQLNIEFGVST